MITVHQSLKSEGVKLLFVLVVSQKSRADHKNCVKCSGTVCLSFATYFVWESFWKDALHVQSQVLSHWHVGKWNVCVCSSAKTDCEVVAASLPDNWNCFWPNPQQDCAVLKSSCWLVNCVQCTNLVELVVICRRMGIDCMRAYCIRVVGYRVQKTQDPGQSPGKCHSKAWYAETADYLFGLIRRKPRQSWARNAKWMLKLFLFCWSLLYSAVLQSKVDSLCFCHMRL